MSKYEWIDKKEVISTYGKGGSQESGFEHSS